MLKLKALKAKSKYKNTEAWLDAVYRNNKEYIDSKIIVTSTRESKKAIFKRMVGEYMEEGLSPTKALKTVSKSSVFVPYKERAVSNAYTALKADKLAYQQFRELTKSGGKYTKIDMGKFVWDPDQKVYVYDNEVIIRFDNSPKQVIVSPVM